MTNKTLRDYINLVENAQRKSVAEGLNEFAPNGFNGGDDDEGFSPEIAKMAQEDGFTKGVSLADGATLAQAITINHWHNQHGGMYKQYFAKGFKKGRLDKIRHNNKQYNLNLKLMKDGSIRHGEQGVAEGYIPIVVPKPIKEPKTKPIEVDIRMNPAKEQGMRDAMQGKPYKNPYKFDKNKSAPENADYRLYKSGYKSAKEGITEGADEGLSKYSTERLQAYVKKVSGGGVPAFGSGAKLKRVQAELKRREQGVAEDQLEETSPDAIEKIEQLVRK